MGTQTDSTADTQTLEDIRDQIENAINIEEVRELLAKNWPEEAYNHTEIKEGNPITCLRRDEDLLLCLSGKENKNMLKGPHR